MAKAFISFLGTSDYLNCRYSLNDTPGEIVKYVQEDLVRRCCMDWNSHDEIRIFTTAEAVGKNWQDNGHADWKTKKEKISTGLENRFKALGIDAAIKRIDIPKGDNEEQIWEIFNKVFSTLREDEEIVIDITHGFRSLPVLLMTLIGYSRLLKNISVSGIYYGAFEVLGDFTAANKIPEDERIAPIFDLTSFEKIIEWTQATQGFVKNGTAKDLKHLASKRINPVLKESRGADSAAKAMDTIVNGIEMICQNILVNRGTEILHYDYEKIKDQLQKLRQEDVFIAPLAPLFVVIEEKIDGFAKDDINNGFRAVDWCVSHGMIQQAITMLQENMATFLLTQVGEDWGVEKNRDAVSLTMNLVSQKKSNLDVDSDVDDAQRQLIKKLMVNPILLKLYKSYEQLRSIRNDVNHGGFRTEENKKASSSQSIQDKFGQSYTEIRRALCNPFVPS
ncbi:MAG: TIGR02221 family CRISPR-associated protein [Desulfobacterium sp.]|nr:TIGR02221 family CRISPR-associated protein [Desulfobacterium sp.]